MTETVTKMIETYPAEIRNDRQLLADCDTTGRVLSRHTGYDATITRAVLEACAQACKSCGDECAQHADSHEHCRICAEVCRRCEEACHRVLSAIG